MRTIKIQIVGRSPETDAPSVDDLLDQLRDYFDILRSVEEAIAEDGTAEIDWRVIDASKNSPLALEAAAFSRRYATIWSSVNRLRFISGPLSGPEPTSNWISSRGQRHFRERPF